MFNNTQDKGKNPHPFSFLTHVERMSEISSQWEIEIDHYTR